MTDVDYDNSTLCGPADARVIRNLEKFSGHKLDAAYLRHIKKFHGGIPGKQYFDAQNGKTYRVGRFLTLVDEKSKLKPPERLSWEFGDRDIRIDWSMLTLIAQEGPSCRQLFELLPFAALYRGKLHPDEMSLTRAHCDLVCFLYESKRRRPRVVVWLADKSFTEYDRWETAEDEVRYDKFTVPVAPHFEEFLELLRPKK
jgi:hypothetical protein